MMAFELLFDDEDGDGEWRTCHNPKCNHRAKSTGWQTHYSDYCDEEGFPLFCGGCAKKVFDRGGAAMLAGVRSAVAMPEALASLPAAAMPEAAAPPPAAITRLAVATPEAAAPPLAATGLAAAMPEVAAPPVAARLPAAPMPGASIVLAGQPTMEPQFLALDSRVVLLEGDVGALERGVCGIEERTSALHDDLERKDAELRQLREQFKFLCLRVLQLEHEVQALKQSSSSNQEGLPTSENEI